MSRGHALALVLIALTFDAAGQLFKCQQDGRTVYQQEKCPETSRQTTLRAPDPVAPLPQAVKAAEEKQTEEVKVDIDRLADVMVGYQMCSEEADFRARYALAYDEWGARNAAAFKRFNADPEATRLVRAREQTERERVGSGGDLESRARRAAVCARVIGAIAP